MDSGLRRGVLFAVPVSLVLWAGLWWLVVSGWWRHAAWLVLGLLAVDLIRQMFGTFRAGTVDERGVWLRRMAGWFYRSDHG